MQNTVKSIADTIFHNANVLTLNKHCLKAEAVAISNGKIIGVANKDNIKQFASSQTKFIDCQGKTLMPGFYDAHCHVFAFAESLIALDLTPNTVSSIADMQDKIRALSQNLPSESWIRGRGYNEFYLDEKRHPTRYDLDQATTKYPVKLTHRSGHAHVLNSIALSLAGITTETPEPPGGMIERDLRTGEPNGLLYGMGEYLAKVIPPLGDEELAHGIKLANEKLILSGITSIQDASPLNDVHRWELFQRWKNNGSLKPRVNMMLGVNAFTQGQYETISQKTDNSSVCLGAIKIMLDETRGQLNPPQTELNQKVLQIHKSGLQVALHAVEENTIEASCLAIEYALQQFPRSDHRHRIEHCSVCTPEQAKRLADIGTIVVTQPAFIYYSGDRYLKTVPAKQIEYLYPTATLIKTGVKVAASSDCPVVTPDPIIGIYATVSRFTEQGQILLSQERTSALRALNMYTRDASYACFEEDNRGSIEPGKFADFVLISADLTKIEARKIKDLKVEMTVIGGEIIYQNDA